MMITANPNDEDMKIMAAGMRTADSVEAMAYGFISPYNAVKSSVGHSVASYVVTDDKGDRLAIFGLCLTPLEPGFGKPWLVSTPELSDHPVTVLKASREIVEHWRESLSLYNFVHAENRDAIHFIETVGFDVDPIPHRLDGTNEMFHLFWMGDKPCVSQAPQ